MATQQSAALALGTAWYAEHKAHVDKMMAGPRWNKLPAVAPSGGDKLRPELWKDIHWKWWVSLSEAVQ